MERKKGNPVVIVVILILLVAAAGLATNFVIRYMPTKEKMSLEEFYGVPGEGEAVLILGTDIMEKRAILSGENIYLPLGLVNTYLNQRYYWDQENQQMIYTTPSEVTYSPASAEAGGDVWLTNDDVYISAGYLQRYTDVDVYRNEEPARITIQYGFDTRRYVNAAKNTEIRYKGGIKSPILREVPAGELLILMAELENWDQVGTMDGYIGYIRKNAVSAVLEETPPRERQMEEYSYIRMDVPVNLAWHQITSMEANSLFAEDTAAMTGVNVISPTWFSLSDNAGNFVDYSSTDYVNAAHAKGLQVWALIDNFSEAISTYEIFSHTASRQALVRNLTDAALRLGIEGINIDFEMMKEETGVHFLEFLRELSVETHKNGLVLSVDNPVPEDFTSHYDRAEQGRVVDYVIIMGYDEHYLGSPTAGPVASLPWVEKGITDTLEEVPAERVINGVPFYTRLWKVMAESVTSEAMGMEQSRKVLEEHKAETYWDNVLCLHVGSYEADGATWQMWLEDNDSLAMKADLVKKYSLAGIAEWKLGLEDSSVWQVITDHISGT